VLVGDAGHFKDPAIGRGIGDAFMQAETLASALHAGLKGSTRDLDAAMVRWGRWRNREFAEHYWLANDLGRAGSLPAVLPEIVRRLHERGEANTVLDLLNHRVKPSQVITPARAFHAASDLIRREPGARSENVHGLAALAADNVRRAWLNRRPAFASEAQSDRPARFAK
jgi:2-polyprenyl-6-methoxyphenol hydroxylase-like FAD-dependent oxidoreductase